uniref:Glycosyltransferase family 28 N-terminal domain-containing protein n=1 Tax=Fagus sylvatica TaxID=28930 RepID=A0A2N9GJ54_FAGSY
MEAETEERTKPIAIFMAFGTKGDVYPIAAIAAAFACDQKQYNVLLITHSAHKGSRKGSFLCVDSSMRKDSNR